MGKDYINPPSREDFEYFKDFSNLQIVILCEFELLRTDKRFKPDDPKQLLNKYIVNWKKNEFKELKTWIESYVLERVSSDQNLKLLIL
mgnify:CR=1 FL=1